MVAALKSPTGWFRWGSFGGVSLVVWVAPAEDLLIVVGFCDGGPGGGFIDDGFAFGVGGDEGLQGEVVDCTGVAAGGGVDEGERVVGEEGVDRPARARWCLT
jgi:hypothetical protein